MIHEDLKGAFLLVIFALITAFSYNHIYSKGIALFGQWDSSEGVISAISKDKSITASIEIINPEIVKQIVKKKERLILDVRRREIYNQGHLPGALSFPLVDFDENIGMLLDSVSKTSPILVYCSSVECSDSHTAAEQLKSLKYENIKVFSGGFRQWLELGHETEKNEE